MTRRLVRLWLGVDGSLDTKETIKTVSIRLLNKLRESKFIEFFRIENSDELEGFKITNKGLSFLLDHGASPRTAPTSSYDSEQMQLEILATEVRISWEQILPKHMWISERNLPGNDRYSLPAAKLIFIGGGDLTNMSAAIEIELTPKSRDRYVKKFQDYKNSTYDAILYFTKNDQITKVIHDVSRDITNLIFVCQIDEFLKLKGDANMVSHNDHFIIRERILCSKNNLGK